MTINKKTVKIIALICLILVTGVCALAACTTTPTADNSHVHTEVIDDAVAPTCTESGLTRGKHCSTCNKVLVEQKVVEAYGHKEATNKAVAVTCTTDGLTEGKYCSICSEIIVEQEVIPALGHTVVTDFAVSATCTTDGLTEGSHCSTCETVFVKQTVITAAHTEVVDDAVPATCTTDGLTRGKHCSACGSTLVAQSVVPAKGHAFGGWFVTVNPTETEQGTKRRDCVDCDAYETDIVAALSHEHSRWPVTTLEAVAVTCTTNGLTEGKKCSGCGEILVAQETIPASGHTYTTVITPMTCTTDGYATHTCHCGDYYTDSRITAPGHTVVTDAAVAVTCTTDGRTEGSHCSTCGEVFVAQSIIKATGHTTVVDKAVAATCTTDGLTEGKHCSTCTEVLVAQTVVTAYGHNMVNHSAKEPTCTAAGWDAYSSCSRCGYLENYNEKSATGHVEVIDAAVPATCTTLGRTEGKHCSVCKSILVSQKTVEKAPHSYSFGAVSGAPQGVFAFVCNACDAVQDIDIVRYSDYGAVGNGVTDDSAAIRRAHTSANYFGVPVEGTSGATYYIGPISETIVIKTSTDWKGASFIFDDSKIMWNDSTLRSVQVFTITHDDQYLYYDITVPTSLKNNGLKKGQTKIEGLNLSAPAMILVENSNQRIFKRYGVNADSGDAMQEMLYVDKDGNIIGTPVQYDYSTITKIRVYSVTDAPISVGNAKITTIVPDPKAQDPDYENNYCFYNRGIAVRRSNTVLYNIEHIIEGEDMSVIIDRDRDGHTGTADPDGDGLPEQWTDDKSYGVPYSGFFGFEYSYNVEFKDCQVQGHQAYNFYQTGGRNEMGSYDIYAKYCVDLKFNGITQRENYGEYTADTVITNRFMYHGIMGSYYCRNIVMDDCYLDRFDSHKGMHNATITDSTLGFGILVIGGGRLYIENVYRVSEGAFILLREDYNSVFDGDLIIKNCRMGASITSIIRGSWRSFDCGLPNYMFRTVTIEGLTSEASGATCKLYVYQIANASKSATSDAVNPLYLPTSITVSGVESDAWLSTNIYATKTSNDAFSTVSFTKK